MLPEKAMPCTRRNMPNLGIWVALTVLFTAGGCHFGQRPQAYVPMDDVMPRELSKVVLPPYSVEPPDILTINDVYLMPNRDYALKPRDVVRITVHRKTEDPLREGDLVNIEVEGVPLNQARRMLNPGDVLEISVADVLPESFVERFQVNDNGKVELRVPEMEEVRDLENQVVSQRFAGIIEYGSVDVQGKSVEEAEQAIKDLLAERFPQVAVTAVLLQGQQAPTSGQQSPIRDRFVVHHRADGENEIILPPPFGRVLVTGMNVTEVESAISDRVRTLLFQVTVRVSLLDATPINASYWIELDGSIDLDNPVKFARTAGEGVGTLYNIHMDVTGERSSAQQGATAWAEGGPGVQPGGTTQRPSGPSRGRVAGVSGATLSEARELVIAKLKASFQHVDVAMSVEEVAALQHIQGEHLVCPDGTVTLGTYGSVSVVGLTLAQAKAAIEEQLRQDFQQPEVSVDVFAYNSKKFYVITQGAGMGDGVYPFPITGNETVLDAIAQIDGLSQVSSKRIWVARPTPNPGQAQVMPVDWEAITAHASTETNYQLLPGDRVFIAEDELIALDVNLSKIIAPVERIMGFSLLGAGTATRFSGPVLKGGGNRRGNF